VTSADLNIHSVSNRIVSLLKLALKTTQLILLSHHQGDSGG